MKAPDYGALLALINSARLLLAKNAGELTPADLRIRCLVNITGKEAQRALHEVNASARPTRSVPGVGRDKENSASRRTHPHPAHAVAAR